MRYYIALSAVLHGDLDPMAVVWSHRSDVSNLGAGGDRTAGWNAVHSYYQNLERMNLAGKVSPDDITVVTQGTMGYSVCTEKGQIRSPDGRMTNYNQRATNIFRLEEGKWKLVHHHVDANSLNGEPTR
jgi:ketosteroid isomerase-like protein